jgi:hypothetical protein
MTPMLAFYAILAMWHDGPHDSGLPNWAAYIIFPLAAVLIFVLNWLKRKK